VLRRLGPGRLLPHHSGLDRIVRARLGLIDSFGNAQTARMLHLAVKGAVPGELPFVRIDRFELVINSRTAKTLGLVLSNSMQLLADEVIE